MRKYLSAFLAVGLLLSMPVMSRAATVTLTATDTSAADQSFTQAGHWSNGLAPTSGNDYVVPVQFLRTPYDNGTTFSFAGDSLTITNGGGMIIKAEGHSYVTIDDLRLVGGGLVRSGANPASSIWEQFGNITVTGSGEILADQSTFILRSSISGTGDLTLSGALATTLHGTNAMSGDIIVSAGTKTFSSNSLCVFTIGADGVNNAITGTGAVFDGAFSFDLGGASTTVGDSWAVTTAGATFGTTFVVNGFFDNGDGSWYLDNGSGKYKFYEDTGVLEAVIANVIPISTQDITPADGLQVFVSQPEIAITLVDGNFDAVNTGSIVMSVDSNNVTPSVTSPGSGTNVVSYTPPSPLAAGPVSVQVTFDDDSFNSYTNTWTFNVHATTANKLWNINIAGNYSTAILSNVTDGVIAVAPSAGLNMWNNVAGDNNVVNTFNITDANGANTIHYETSGSHNWGLELSGNAGAGSMTVQMFQGWTGANAPMNMTNVLYDLDPNNAYDLYIYSTWAWTQNDVAYEIIEGYGDELSGTVSETWSYVTYDNPTNYSDCVEGENYIILHSVTPTAAGRIAFTGICPDGALSGLQLLEIPGAGTRPDIIAGGSEPSDGAVFVTNTPTLKAYFVDIDGSVNSGAITMTVDGNAVSPSYSYSAPTSTVSYTVSSPFDPFTLHTAKVVVASTPSGTLYTNEWSFTVAPVAGNRIYVDADTTNTLQWTGATFGSFTPDGVGSNWTTRTVYGNNGTVYQSLVGTAPRLKTTVSGLPSGTYDVYAYMWVQGNDWRMEAALTNNLAGELPLYKRSEYPANSLMSAIWADYDPANTWGDYGTPAPNPYLSTNLLVNPFASGTVMVAEADRRLVEVYLGQVSGTEFTVYVDDDPVVPGDRTWYDGVGYEAYTGGPGFNPVINSITVAGGTVTINWTSDTIGTYQIESKSSLTSPTWSPVAGATGLSGGTGQSTAFSVSGDPAEFFQVYGE